MGNVTTVARVLTEPNAIAVAPDSAIYVGERAGQCRVCRIRDGEESTLHEGESQVRGLFLHGDKLYVTTGNRILTIAVGTPAEQQEARYYPALQTWALMQEEGRAEMIPAAPPSESTEEARARCTLRLLMDCPIPDILVRTLRFLYCHCQRK